MPGFAKLCGKRFTAALLAALMLGGLAALPVCATEESISTPPEAPAAEMAAGEYHAGDAAVLDQIIRNNWPAADSTRPALNDPGDWGRYSRATWSEDAPKRVVELDLKDSGLAGTLDVSGLAALTTLNCNLNQLTGLNVAGLPALQTLWCGTNQLTQLANLPPSLTDLNYEGNALPNVDISGLSNLQSLACGNNGITQLGPLPAGLVYLDCSDNALTRLPTLPAGLTDLGCGGNQLTALDLSPLTGLQRLWCYNNPFEMQVLDLSAHHALRFLNCAGNNLQQLILPAGAPLQLLDCSENYMRSLDVSGFTSLNSLNLFWNKDLTTLTTGGNALASLVTPAGHRVQIFTPSAMYPSDGGTGHIDSYELASNTITLHTVADEGYQHLGWNILSPSAPTQQVQNAASPSAATFVPNGNYTLAPTFEPQPDPNAPTGLALNMKSKVLKAGKKVTLKARILPAGATAGKLKWTSSKPKVAKVNAKGVVTAKEDGITTITVRTATGQSAKCKITVSSTKVAVAKLRLAKPKSATLRVGKALALKAKISPANASSKKVSWKSSNPAVATVSSKGKVKALAPGKAKITATTSEGGKKASITITVKAKN